MPLRSTLKSWLLSSRSHSGSSGWGVINKAVGVGPVGKGSKKGCRVGTRVRVGATLGVAEGAGVDAGMSVLVALGAATRDRLAVAIAAPSRAAEQAAARNSRAKARRE